MALEQFRAFRSEQPLPENRPFERIAPDNYPLLKESELRSEHLILSEMLRIDQGGFLHDHGIRDQLMPQEQPFRGVLESDDEQRTRLCLALIERTFAFDAKLSQVEGFAFSNFF